MTLHYSFSCSFVEEVPFKKKCRFNSPLSSTQTLKIVATQIVVEGYFVPLHEGHMPLEHVYVTISRKNSNTLNIN